MDQVKGRADTRWLVVAVGFLCGIAGIFQTAKMSVALVEVQQAIGLDLVAASWSTTVVSLTGALFGIQAGRFVAEAGVERSLILALVVSTLGALATAAIGHPLLFLASRAFEGIGYLLVCTAAPALMAAAARPADRGVALAIWGAFVPVGVSVMGLAGPPVLEASGWRMVFVLSALTLPAMMVLVLAMRRGPRPAPGPALGRTLAGVLLSSRHDLGRLYARPSAIAFGSAFLAFAAIQVGLIALLPTYLELAVGLDAGAAGRFLSIITPFAIAGTAVAAVLLRLAAPTRAIALAGFVGMAAGSAALLTPGLGEPALLAAGAGFFTAGGLVGSALFASIPLRSSQEADIGLYSGLLVQFGNIGALVGAPILASVVDGADWSGARLVVLAMAVAGGLAALVDRWGRR